MSAPSSADARHPLLRSLAWHRPLMTVAVLMGACALLSVGGLLLDPREVLGQPLWAKPLKFSLSILLYTVTWAWLIAQLPRWRRVARGLGTVIAVALLVEQVLIVGAAVTGTTSHFNVSSGWHTAVWATMGVAITVLYLCTFVISVAVLFLHLPTPAFTLALRAGALIALGGIGVAFLMTTPTPDQLNDFDGVAGAHSVGVPDGGAGLPLLGWSTAGGDYRVPHFVGMHALQLLPLLALVLLIASRRIPLLTERVQHRLVAVAAGAYAALLVLLTVQAAVGQSVVRPAGVVLVAGAVLVTATASASVAVLISARAEYAKGGREAVHPRAADASPTKRRYDSTAGSGVTARSTSSSTEAE